MRTFFEFVNLSALVVALVLFFFSLAAGSAWLCLASLYVASSAADNAMFHSRDE